MSPSVRCLSSIDEPWPSCVGCAPASATSLGIAAGAKEGEVLFAPAPLVGSFLCSFWSSHAASSRFLTRRRKPGGDTAVSRRVRAAGGCGRRRLLRRRAVACGADRSGFSADAKTGGASAVVVAGFGSVVFLQMRARRLCVSDVRCVDARAGPSVAVGIVGGKNRPAPDVRRRRRGGRSGCAKRACIGSEAGNAPSVRDSV